MCSAVVYTSQLSHDGIFAQSLSYCQHWPWHWVQRPLKWLVKIRFWEHITDSCLYVSQPRGSIHSETECFPTECRPQNVVAFQLASYLEGGYSGWVVVLLTCLAHTVYLQPSRPLGDEMVLFHCHPEWNKSWMFVNLSTHYTVLINGISKMVIIVWIQK